MPGSFFLCFLLRFTVHLSSFFFLFTSQINNFKWPIFRFADFFLLSLWVESLSLLNPYNEFFNSVIVFFSSKIYLSLLIISISFLIFSFCLYIIFLISFSPLFFFSSLSIFKTFVLKSLSSKSYECVSSSMVSGGLFCSFEQAMFLCFLVCLVIFVENWAFEKIATSCSLWGLLWKTFTNY